MQKWTSRKLAVFAILTTVFTFMLYRTVLTSDNYVDLMVFLWGAYVAGNVGEHFSNKK